MGGFPCATARTGRTSRPPLAWSDLPAGTEELALLFENITPQTKEPFVQWLVYEIPPDRSGLPEGYKHKADPRSRLT
jgi:phosphatidylethanolamine-binding protein (PEBP) family uncharacterized protein